MLTSKRLTSQSIKVIDPATRRVVDSVPTGAPESQMLAITAEGDRAYTANVGAGTISAIDLRNKNLLAVISVSKSVQRIAISHDDRWVLTSDQTKPELVVIDARTNTIKTRIPLPALGFGLAATHDGRLLVTHPDERALSIVSLKTMRVETTISVPAQPQEILIRPDDRIAYISCDESKQVVALELASLKVTKTFKAGAGEDGLALTLRSRRRKNTNRVF